MKNKPLLIFALSACIYFAVYMLTVFYHWKFYNPFLWILQVPSWHGGQRIGLLCFLILYYTGNYCVVKGITRKQSDKFKESDAYGISVILYFLSLLCVALINCNC